MYKCMHKKEGFSYVDLPPFSWTDIIKLLFGNEFGILPDSFLLIWLFCKCWGLADQQAFLAPNTLVFGAVLFAQQ